MTINDLASKTISNVTDFIQGKSYKSFSELVSGNNGNIMSTLGSLRSQASEAEQSKDAIEYQFAFALKRDAISRYASRKLLYASALDKKLYNSNLLQATSMLNNQINQS